jgi:hypothetical protein
VVTGTVDVIAIFMVFYLPPRSCPMTGTLANGFDELWLLEEDEEFVAFPEDEVELPPLLPPISCPMTGTLANGFDEF